jgi:hypothetical protein
MGVFKKYCCEQMGMTLFDMVEPDNLSDVLFTALSNVFKESSWKSKKHFNGKELDGRAINVSLARPKEDRPRRDNDNGGRSFGGNGGGGGSFRQRSW